MFYISFKGLFGLTGASFIAFDEPATVEVDSFYLGVENHISKTVTGPYHVICSLADVLPRHNDFRTSVVENKRVFSRRMRDHLTLPLDHQPLLCTHVDCEIRRRDPRAILYESRGNLRGSVVCHLGEVHLGRRARADILDGLELLSARSDE